MTSAWIPRLTWTCGQALYRSHFTEEHIETSEVKPLPLIIQVAGNAAGIWTEIHEIHIPEQFPLCRDVCAHVYEEIKALMPFPAPTRESC